MKRRETSQLLWAGYLRPQSLRASSLVPRTLFSPRTVLFLFSTTEHSCAPYGTQTSVTLSSTPKAFIGHGTTEDSKTKKAWTLSLKRSQSSGGGQEYEPLMITDKKTTWKLSRGRSSYSKGRKEKTQAVKKHKKGSESLIIYFKVSIYLFGSTGS